MSHDFNKNRDVVANNITRETVKRIGKTGTSADCDLLTRYINAANSIRQLGHGEIIDYYKFYETKCFQNPEVKTITRSWKDRMDIVFTD
jgi:hypothetical protein